jgi:heterotetrameric sarcosine oxidase alpha subunit
MNEYRLPSGGRIDRSRPLQFKFDGRSYVGFAGDTLASALLANGVALVGRSFKYHRPRGIVSAGSEEPNALVELRSGGRREPNTRATTVELFEGLEASSQNRFPSLKWDLLSMTAPLSAFMSAGFYYKTFMWPASFWEKLYEPLIRRAAGLGRAAESADPDTYEKAFAFCDVLVIGAGPAGLSAALAAARAGARVIVCDEDFEFGGRLLSERRLINGAPSQQWLAQTIDKLKTYENIVLMPRTTVFGVYDQQTFGAVERVSDHLPTPPKFVPRQRVWRIVAKQSVLAAGSIERPLVFGGNDLPGVMLGGAVRSYVNRYGVAPGRKGVVATSNDDGWRTANDLRAAGVNVVAVIDSRAKVEDALNKQAAGHGTTVYLGARIAEAKGRHRVTCVSVTDDRGQTHTLACDLVAASNGWNPTLHLTTHLGGRPSWNDAREAFVPGTLPAGMQVAGAAAGDVLLIEALRDGYRAGANAAVQCGHAGQDTPSFECDAESYASETVWDRTGQRGKAFIDLQNDVTDSDVALAVQEGFRSVEHVKRYTTLGMATDQGKTSGVLGHAHVAKRTGKALADIGTTVFRPPYTPVALGALAGHHRGKDFRPYRLTPAHGVAAEQGAVFVETGYWLRAQYFPEAGDRDWLDAVMREVKAVRSGVGICDVSTLGKIDLQGQDVAEFLDRVYINAWSTLAVGKARYGLMLRDDGVAFDDGTTARLSDNHFIMTTTTANAGRVMQHLEYCHQVLWPDLDVRMVSVTEQWAQFAVAGPRSRDVLRKVVDAQFDISNEAFPYLASQAVTVGGGVPARLFRISFSGELAYELAVEASYGEAAVRALLAAGAEHGIRLYGTEALSVMRIEKGHIAGNELNGQTTARDLGLDRMMSKKKDFIGRVMAGREAFGHADRPRFVGFKPVNLTQRLRAGAHFIPTGKAQTAENDQGFISSVTFSPELNHWIGLGFLERGPERIGERLIAADPLRGESIEVEVCKPAFVDPGEERLRV